MRAPKLQAATYSGCPINTEIGQDGTVVCSGLPTSNQVESTKGAEELRQLRSLRRLSVGILLLFFRKIASAFSMALSAMLSPWYGTVSEGSAVAGIGCGALAAIAIAVLVAALALLYVFARPTYHASSNISPALGGNTSSSNAAATTGAADSMASPIGNDLGDAQIEQLRTESSTPSSRNMSAGGNPSDRLSGTFDEAELQAQRLKALRSGNIVEYNLLIKEHLAKYREYHVDPCASGFFPQGCSQGSTYKTDDGLRSNAEPSEGSPLEKSREAKPDDIPAGTVPIDQIKGRFGWDKDQLHNIKDAVGAGPKDWVGVDKNGNIWTGENGHGVNHGHWSDLVH